MNFLNLQNECASQARFDSTVAANLTIIKRHINRAQQYLAGRHPWSWLQTREIVQTVADKTAGTVSINSAATTVTGSGTSFASTDVGSYIQFSSSNDWYRITTYTSATSIAIESNYTASTNLSSGTYTIRKFYYAMSSAVDRVISVRQAITPVKLFPMPFITLQRWTPFHSTTGKPYLFAVAGPDATYSAGALDTINVGNWNVQFYPWPDGVYNMEIDYYRVPVDLSANTDTGNIPQKIRDTVLIDGAVAYLYQYLKDSRYQQMWQKFEEGIERFWIEDGVNRGELNVVEAVDATTQDPDIINYPSGYPRPYG